MREDHNSEGEGYYEILARTIQNFIRNPLNHRTFLDYLEFSEDSEFFDAFQMPEHEEGMTVVGRDNKKIDDAYLINEWMHGRNAGIFHAIAEKQFPGVWTLDKKARNALCMKWTKAIIEDDASKVTDLVCKYNRCRQRIDQINREKEAFILKGKRIIGCTTTAAAKYNEEIREASPGIVIVEEAGEILEIHILTALSANTKQLVMIGDHKQLRPKVSNYSLTAEKGDGYDLNVSMFERLVVAGMPHTTLNLQHRMRPEISTLVRSLTYPELEDAPGTKQRPSLRGFQDNVIFVSHDQPELNAESIADRRDEDQRSSKENEYEVDMVLKCVRYLGQQGYSTDKMVILTPYLGQLYRLVKTLSQLEDSDPWLNDLDSFELVRAGLLTPAGADISKKRIKISTIGKALSEDDSATRCFHIISY